MLEKYINENFRFEAGTDTDVLLLLFGGYGKITPSLEIPKFEWLQVARFYQYHRIFVRDPGRRMCMSGIGGQLDTWEKLIAALREIVRELGVRKIITVGTSAGSFPAILAAHLLQADYCHAFAPYSYTNLKRSILKFDWRMVRAIWSTGIVHYFRPGHPRHYFDLRPVLAATNGHTRYFLHVCRHSKIDYRRAMHIADLPNVTLLGYPCDQHIVVRYVAKLKFLDKIFDINNQQELDQMLEKEIERHNARKETADG